MTTALCLLREKGVEIDVIAGVIQRSGHVREILAVRCDRLPQLHESF